MNDSLSEKNIVVTGGLGKIGQIISNYLYNENANVIVLARLAGKPSKLIDQYREKMDLINCDLSDESSFLEAIQEIMTNYKYLHGLVTSTSYRPMTKGIDDSLENWVNSITINSTAIYQPCKVIGKMMCKQGFGSIVNISSIYGLGSPLKSLYHDSNLSTEPDYPFLKGGTIALTKYLASFFAEFNVRVNAIAPGGVFNNQPDAFVSNYNSRIPMGRMASGLDIANAVNYLLSDQSSYVTGVVLPVDGGWTAT